MTRRLLIFVPLVLALVLIPGAAQAHSVITSSQPMAGQRLGTAPGVLILEFSEALNTKLSRAIVTPALSRGACGTLLRRGRRRHSPSFRSSPAACAP